MFNKISKRYFGKCQSELPKPIPGYSAESDHGCTSRIYFDNADDNVTLTLHVRRLRQRNHVNTITSAIAATQTASMKLMFFSIKLSD